MYVTIDRTSKVTYAELHKSQTKMSAAEFLRHLIQAVPYKIHKVPTDNGIPFTNHDHHKNAFTHLFERVCNEHELNIKELKSSILGPTDK